MGKKARFRYVLAPVMVMLLLLQSIMPGVMAQEASPDATEPQATTEVVETVESTTIATEPVVVEPTETPAPTPVWLAQLQPDVNYWQATCATAAALNIDHLLYNTAGIEKVEYLDATESVVSQVFDASAAPGTSVWVKVTFADSYVFDGSSHSSWLSRDNGASAQTKIDFTAAPTADDCASAITLPAPTVADEAVCEDPIVIDVAAIEALDGVATVSADGDVVAGDDVVVRVSFEDGFKLDKTSKGWTLDKDGTATYKLAVPACAAMMGISPMSVDAGPSGITSFKIEPSAPATMTELVQYKFEWSVVPPAGGTLQAGDGFNFNFPRIAEMDRFFVTGGAPDFEPIDLYDPNNVVIGQVTINEDGTGRLELNSAVNGYVAASGSFQFGQDSQWAEGYRTNNPTGIPFVVTQEGKTDLPATLTVPPLPTTPTTPVPTPGTNPAKSGAFKTGDQGRTNPEDAIYWALIAPAGPASGAVITDTYTAETGMGEWAFDCSDFTFTPSSNNPIGVVPTVVCDNGTVTVTWPAYPDWTTPVVYVYADITDLNNQVDPADGALTFKNTISSKVWKVGDNPATTPPHATGTATAVITQTGTRDNEAARHPYKSGWFVGPDEARTNPVAAIQWAVNAPPGPTDGVVLTDHAKPGWEFDCTTFVPDKTTSYAGGDPESYEYTCTPELITVTIGAYMEPQGSYTPGYTVRATRTAEQPAYYRDVLIFSNTVTSELKPYNWDGTSPLIPGSSTSTIKQTPPALPAANPTKTARMTRPDAGFNNRSRALEWTINLPAGPNGKIELTDSAQDGMWKFSCSSITIGGSYTAPVPAVIDCTPGQMNITFPQGYTSGTPVIKVRADLLVPYDETNLFENDANVRVYDYLPNSQMNNGLGYIDATAHSELLQRRSSGGAGQLTPGAFKVSVGDYIWYDNNANGMQDAGEPVVPNHPVTLYAADGTTVVATTTTDANGYYFFKDLLSDTDYVIEFGAPPAGYVWTTQDAPAAADDMDSDVDPITNRISFMSEHEGSNLTGPGQTDDPTRDGGLVKPVSIGDYVWFDTNKDGLQTAGEAPVAGVVVKLFKGTTEIGSTTTDAAGYYGFKDLQPETEYSLKFELPADYAGWTTQDANSNGSDAADSDVNAAGEVTFTSPAMAGSNNQIGQNVADNPTLDAGLFKDLVSVGDFVWIDTNGNGQQDAGEPPVPGVKVELILNGTVIDTATTDATGYYWFDDVLPATEHTLKFTKPAGYQWTHQNMGADASDSDVDRTTGELTFTSPESGLNKAGALITDNPTLDAGLIAPVSVGDYVWYDKDWDGVQDATETPIAGVPVKLLIKDGAGWTEVSTTTTNASGYYNFKDLIPNTDYRLEFTNPNPALYNQGWTVQDAGGDDAKDSDVSPAGVIEFKSNASGSNLVGPNMADNPTLDAGLSRKPVSVGDYV